MGDEDTGSQQYAFDDEQAAFKFDIDACFRPDVIKTAQSLEKLSLCELYDRQFTSLSIYVVPLAQFQLFDVRLSPIHILPRDDKDMHSFTFAVFALFAVNKLDP